MKTIILILGVLAVASCGLIKEENLEAIAINKNLADSYRKLVLGEGEPYGYAGCTRSFTNGTWTDTDALSICLENGWAEFAGTVKECDNMPCGENCMKLKFYCKGAGTASETGWTACNQTFRDGYWTEFDALSGCLQSGFRNYANEVRDCEGECF